MGLLFSGYQIIETIHVGKVAEILRGKRLIDDRKVVLKVVNTRGQRHLQVAQLEYEYEMLRSLQNPELLRVLELRKNPGRLALVMEDRHGLSLDRVLREQRPSVERWLAIFMAFARQLGLLHQEKVIHKNINPTNAILDPESGVIRIIDFAMATRLSRENRKTPPPGWVEGALPYVSPEQTGRMNRAIDYRADFYMLGVSFYQLLTGRLPFRSKDPLELIHSHIARTPQSVRDINPQIPESLAAIVAALMAKNAEDRYQSIQGLVTDLDFCHRNFGKPETCADFRLGSGDVVESFRIPQKLYGRKKEIEMLEANIGRIGKGGRELVLIEGKSGEGKTALIRELYQPLAHRRGFLIEGRFERLKQNLPFGSLMQALGDLVRQLLSESAERLGRWRQRILAALGSNCRIMVEVVPELALIVGNQPAVAKLPQREKENRFHMVVHKFVSVFARVKYPLVLFLDDLQWADAASLELIQDLMGDEEIQALLLICTLRTGEEAQEVLLNRIRSLREQGVTVYEQPLSALKEGHVRQMLAETMHLTEEVVIDPAALVFKKTGGNPIFVNEYLHALHARGVIVFDRDRSCWQWDLTEMQRFGAQGTAVDLMIERIAHLPAPSAEALGLAACIGNPFRLRDLAALMAVAPGHAAELLWPAVEEGLVVPLDPGYNHLRNTGHETDRETALEFLHDQVRQAFSYSPREKKQAHLRIGRMLAKRCREDDNLFEVVSHYNWGRCLIREEDERLQLALLNLAAGKKAAGATAHESGLTFLRIAAELLPANGWQDHFQVTHDICVERARCEYLCGFEAESDRLFTEILKRVSSLQGKVAVYKCRTILYTHTGKYLEAIEAGMAGLVLLGLDLPFMDDVLQERILERRAAVATMLEGRPLRNLLDAPELTDPDIRLMLSLLFNIWPAAVNVNRNLVALIILEMLYLTLTHGNTDLSAYAFVGYALLLGSSYGNHEMAREFGELGIRISDKYSDPAKKGPVYCLHASMVLPWVGHYRETIIYLRQAFRTCLDSGDMMWTTQCLVHTILHRFLEGDPLPSIRGELEGHSGLLDRARHEQAGEILTILGRLMQLLQGPWQAALSWSGPEFDESDFLERNQRKMYLISVTQFTAFKAQVAYLFDDLESALAASERVERLAPYLYGWVSMADHYLYSALIHVRCAETEAEAVRDQHLAKARACHARLQEWAIICPANFEHAHFLIKAELARLEQHLETTLIAYEAAIAAARTNEFVHMEALASELAARFLLERGMIRPAQIYLRDACFGYARWGAQAKVGKLIHDYPKLLDQFHAPAVVEETMVSVATEPGQWDMATLKKASLTLSNEIHLATLLEKMIALVIENAGAQSGAFIIEKEGDLVVEAEGHAETGTVSVLQGLSVDEAGRVSRAIVRSVFLSRENLVLSNALREGRFSADPYITAHRVKSVLCRPILSKGEIAGILYLENRALTGAFTPHHLEILDLLTSDAAIAIENARLYAEVTATNARLEEYSRNLEDMVSERTNELQKKNRELEKTLARNREMQRQIIQQEKMASLGTLTAGVAHEIRNPLNFINNFADLSGELLQELVQELAMTRQQVLEGERLASVEELLGDLKTNLGKIHNHGLRADEIVHSMLLHSHHKRPQAPELTDINAMVDKYLKLACQGVRVSHPELKLAVQTHYAKGLVPVEANPGDLGRVFLNIVENACDAVLQKVASGIEDYRPVLTIGTRDLGDWIEVRIRDNGPGIERGNLNRIFNPFYTTKPAGLGTGLGLSISYDIVVKEHQGGLEVDTEEGMFTEFSVRLPKKLYRPKLA